jgi:hypothetical protein
MILKSKYPLGLILALKEIQFNLHFAEVLITGDAPSEQVVAHLNSQVNAAKAVEAWRRSNKTTDDVWDIKKGYVPPPEEDTWSSLTTV